MADVDAARGARIVARMRALNLTVEEVAGRLSVHSSTVASWRSGADLRVSHLRGLCRELGCSSDWLLEGDALTDGESLLLAAYRVQCDQVREAWEAAARVLLRPTG